MVQVINFDYFSLLTHNFYKMIKRIITLFAIAFFIFSCKNEAKVSFEPQTSPTNDLTSYTSVGEKISAHNALSAHEMYERYSNLEVGDTIKVKFVASVNSVCKNKGCWMKLDLENGAEATIKFKDYEFFVPKDIEKKEVVVSGKAYVSETSVDEQRHFAEDAGKSAEEVAAIQKGEKTLAFIADGVLIKP